MRKKLQINLVYGTICTSTFLLYSAMSQAQWTQMGGDMLGASAHNHSGRAVNISNNGYTVIMGAPGNGMVASYQGAVRVFEWNGSTWPQKGATITGDVAGDQLGNGVDINTDGTTIIAGAPYDIGSGANEGQVRVFEWNGSAWIQKGADLYGEGANDGSGRAVSINGNGNTIAIGVSDNDGNGTGSGHVRVFEWNGSTWVQKGNDIDGEAAGDGSGQSVNLTADGNAVAIGAVGNSAGGPLAGHIRVFTWSSSAWQQKGNDIDGIAGDWSGFSVSLSDDSNVVSTGAVANSNSGMYAGTVRAYEWNGSAWIQRGTDINGLNAGDEWGWTVSLSSSGDTLACAAREGSYIRVFRWNGTGWIQIGSNILFSYYTGQVSICADGSKIAIGDPLDNTAGLASGRVRVYSDFPTGILQDNFAGDVAVYPNPTSGAFTLYFNSNNNEDIQVFVTNALGQTVYSKTISVPFGAYEGMIDNGDIKEGYYIVHIQQGEIRANRSVVVIK